MGLEPLLDTSIVLTPKFSKSFCLLLYLVLILGYKRKKSTVI